MAITDATSTDRRPPAGWTQPYPPVARPAARPWWHYLAEAAIIVVGYYLLVRLSFRYSPPPAAIGPIWLPAGMAFATVLFRGYWTLLPLAFVVIGDKLLGDLVLHRRVAADGDLTPATLVVGASLIYAAGVLGHSLLGAWLIRRGVRDPRVEDGRDAAWFLLAAGPISCLVSALLGTTGFVLEGIVGRASIPTSALTFWVGDAIGCMLVGVVVLAVVSSRPVRGRSVALISLTLLTAILVLFVTQLIGRIQTDDARSVFRDEVEAGAERLERDLERIGAGARGLASQASLSGGFQHSTYAPTGQRILDTLSTLDGLVVVGMEPDDPGLGANVSTRPGSVTWIPADPDDPDSRDVVVSPVAPAGQSALTSVGAGADVDPIGYVALEVEIADVVERAFREVPSGSSSVVLAVRGSEPTQYLGAVPVRDNLLVNDDTSPAELVHTPAVVLGVERPIRVEGAGDWELTAAATSVWVSEREQLQAIVPVALLCMGITGTLLLLGLTLSGQRARLSRLVVERTDQLRATEHRYRSVVDSVRDAIFQLDPDDRLQFANDAWTAEGIAAIGTPIVGESFVDALRIDQPALVHCLLADARSAPGTVVRAELNSPDGTHHWELRVAAEGADAATDRPRGIVGVVGDVTAHRAVLRNRERFVSFIAHELRNPLTVISGSISTIAQHDGDQMSPTATKLMPVLRSSAVRLERIIDDLLVASQVDAGTLQLYPSRADLREVVTDAIGDVDMLARDNGIEIVRLDHVHTPANGSFDVDRVQQVVDNLLSNAIKYTPRGGTVSVDVGVDDDGAPFARIRDTGIGMAPEEQSRVFDRFARTDAGAAVATGTGLGLSICLGIATAHGGRIDLESEVGRGSTFTLVLPADAPAQA